MALTRAAIEGRLVLANRGLLELASLPTATDGTNAAVGHVLEDAMKRLGYTVADAGSPSDGEVAVVPAARHPHLYALANVLLLEFVLGTIGAIPTERNIQLIEWHRVTESLQDRIKDGWAEVAKIGKAARSGGVAVGTLQERPYPPDSLAEPWRGTT